MVMRWFAVRTVYAHENSDGPPWYLDRHILIHADDDGDDLLERIEVVSARYLELNPNASVIGDHAAIALPDDLSELNGAEVWCMARHGETEPAEFYKLHYADLELQPEDEV